MYEFDQTDFNDYPHFGIWPDGCSQAVSVQVGFLMGDVNGNRVVNASDIGVVKSQSGNAVTAANFRDDVTADGSLNATDISLTKSRSGTGLP